jgi:hypothetical protein
MTARSIGLGVALSAFVLIGFGQQAFAAGPEYCQRYASNAVQAQLRNIQYRCGFTGRAWSTDYGDHFGWCVRAPWAAAEHEERVRRRLLRACRGY